MIPVPRWMQGEVTEQQDGLHGLELEDISDDDMEDLEDDKVPLELEAISDDEMEDLEDRLLGLEVEPSPSVRMT